MSDERLRQGGTMREDDTPAGRLNKDGTPDKRSQNRFKRPDERGNQERELAGRAMTDKREEMTDDERMMLAVSDSLNSVLPTVAQIPGHSLCWVSTTHPTDTPTRRMAIGWQFVTKADMPEFENLCTKAGEFVGTISCREMILMKLRDALRLRMLTHFHHDMPNDAEQALATQIDALKQSAEKHGMKIAAGDGHIIDAPKPADFDHMF